MHTWMDGQQEWLVLGMMKKRGAPRTSLSQCLVFRTFFLAAYQLRAEEDLGRAKSLGTNLND